MNSSDYKEEFKIKGSFKHVQVYNSRWISTDDPLAPLAKIDDGANDICIMKYEAPRYSLLRFLLDLDYGSWFYDKD